MLSGPIVSGSSPLSRSRGSRMRALARRHAADRLGDGPDVGRRGAAAPADEVDQPVLGELAEHGRHALGRLVVAAELVRQPGVRMRAHEHRRDPGELLDVRAQRLGAEGAVEPDAERAGVRHRVPERLGRLSRQRAAARVRDGARDHHRQPRAQAIEHALDREEGRLGVEGVEDGLDQEQVGPAVDQAPRGLRVGGDQLVERDVPEAGIVDVGRERRGPVGRAEHAGHEARRLRAPLEFVGRRARQPGRGVVQLVGHVLHAVVRQRHGVGGEGVGLDDVGARLEVGGVDRADDVGLREREQVVVPAELPRPVGEPLAPVLPLAQAVGLDHRAHGAVEHQDPLGQQRLEQATVASPGSGELVDGAAGGAWSVSTGTPGRKSP